MRIAPRSRGRRETEATGLRPQGGPLSEPIPPKSSRPAFSPARCHCSHLRPRGAGRRWRIVTKPNCPGTVARTSATDLRRRRWTWGGYEATSFSRTARAMGRPKSAMGYHYSPSRAVLTAAIVQPQQQRWIAIEKQPDLEPHCEFLTTLLLNAVGCSPTSLGQQANQVWLVERGLRVPVQVDNPVQHLDQYSPQLGTPHIAPPIYSSTKSWDRTRVVRGILSHHRDPGQKTTLAIPPRPPWSVVERSTTAPPPVWATIAAYLRTTDAAASLTRIVAEP